MISVPSFAKINLGLKIGPLRPDGFHELRTVYQTLALHDVVRVDVQRGSGIEIRSNDQRVPLDEANTCYKVAERVLAAIVRASDRFPGGEQQVPRLAALARDDNQGIGTTIGTAEAVPLQSTPGLAAVPVLKPSPIAANIDAGLKARSTKIVIEIAKRLPVQGGMGAASSNAVATLLAMERALGVEISPAHKLRIAAEVGSDLPLFLIGGTVLGVSRGEEVYPLPDLPRMHVVVVTPAIGVSTPKAFAHWEELSAGSTPAVGAMGWESGLTASGATGTINEFSERVFTWLGDSFPQVSAGAGPASGVPAMSGNRAETPLLDLVRAGIENDFERVVFPEYPELRKAKELLLREGARYASLSGSGSTVYALFDSDQQAAGAAQRMSAAGHKAIATTTLTRCEYWKAVASGQ
jgi:4-diphosphocytidyl-2-C-methyl-D-erythritol kinase